MNQRKFNGFNKNGYLPEGIFNMTFKELKMNFSEGKSSKRKEIMNEYKKHLTELKNTSYFIDHWIDGSYISAKINPNDIDTLTEFDGFEIDKNKDRETIDNLIKFSKENTNYLCHSLKVYYYPPYDEFNYKKYINTKIRILINLFGHDRNGIPKGIIHLVEE